MKRLILSCAFIYGLTTNIYSQKIGIVYNTDQFIETNQFKTVFIKAGLTQKTNFDVIDYCSKALQKDSTHIEVFNINPTSLAFTNEKIKQICIDKKLDYGIGIIKTPLHTDAIGTSAYKVANKSFGLQYTTLNTKAYFVYFFAKFVVYSRNSNKFFAIDFPKEYSQYEWVKHSEVIIIDDVISEPAVKEGIEKIKKYIDLSLSNIEDIIFFSKK